MYLMAVSDLDSAKATQVTKQVAGVGNWEWAPDSKRFAYVAYPVMN